MGLFGGGVAGAVGGILGGLAGSGQTGGGDVGSNIFAGISPEAQQAYSRLGNYGLQSTANQGMELANQNSLANSTQQVQDNPILSQLFGKNGVLSNTVNQEKDLAGRGFSLQPEDYEAYGQASGDIARQFGQNEQSLSQALADRGLSNSGAAGAAFSGNLGNKNEQLAKIQMGIAQQRMQMNNERLNQTRNFLSQMGNQAQGAIGQANDIQDRQAKTNYGLATDYMGKLQGVNEQAFKDRQESSGPSGLSNFLTGAVGGATSAGKLYSAMSGSGGSGGSMSGNSTGSGKLFSNIA